MAETKQKKTTIKKSTKKPDKVVEKENSIVPIGQRPIIPLMPNVSDLMQLGTALAQSGMFPHAKSAAGAVAIIECGRELGIKPVMALQTMAVIKGKLSIESKALMALAKHNGIQIEVIKKNTNGCQLKFSRGSEKPHTETFTMEDAKRAGLAQKENFKMYPEEMCYWRCGAKGLRVFDPGIGLGLYTKEEMEVVEPREDFSKQPEEETVIEGEVVEELVTEEEKSVEEVKEETEESSKDMAIGIETVIEIIKAHAKVLFGTTYDKQYPDFKEFLLELNEKKRNEAGEPRCFVGKNEHQKLSLHCGKLDDLKLLGLHKGWAFKEYELWKKKREEKKEESDDGIPF